MLLPVMLLPVSFYLRVIDDTLRLILMCHAVKHRTKETLLLSQNDSDERGLVVGCSLSLSLSLQKFNLFPLLLRNYQRFRLCLFITLI